MMDPGEAVVRVLEGDPEHALHWTVIWDRALRDGLVEPNPDARKRLMQALGEQARAGRIEKTSQGTYRLSRSS